MLIISLVVMIILSAIDVSRRTMVIKHVPTQYTTPLFSATNGAIAKKSCNRPTKSPGSKYVTCPDILDPDSDRCRVKCRDLHNNTRKTCKRPKSVLSDSSLNCHSYVK